MKEFKSVQEACDYAVLKIVEQGGQCHNGMQHCMYGNEEGQHCAIGWLLDPDNENLMDFDGGIVELADETEELIPNIIKNNLYVFGVLQDFHDGESICGRKMALEQLHNYYNIDISKPQYQQWVDMGVQQ